MCSEGYLYTVKSSNSTGILWECCQRNAFSCKGSTHGDLEVQQLNLGKKIREKTSGRKTSISLRKKHQEKKHHPELQRVTIYLFSLFLLYSYNVLCAVVITNFVATMSDKTSFLTFEGTFLRSNECKWKAFVCFKPLRGC